MTLICLQAKEGQRFLLWQGLQATGVYSFYLEVSAWQSKCLTLDLVVKRYFVICLLGRAWLEF